MSITLSLKEKTFWVFGERVDLEVRISVPNAKDNVDSFFAAIESVEYKEKTALNKLGLHQRMRSVESLLSSASSQTGSLIASPKMKEQDFSVLRKETAQVIDDNTLMITLHTNLDTELEFQVGEATIKVVVFEKSSFDLLRSSFIRDNKSGAAFLRQIVKESGSSVGHRLTQVLSLEKTIELRQLLEVSLDTARIDQQLAGIDVTIKSLEPLKEILLKNIKLAIRDTDGSTAANACFILEPSEILPSVLTENTLSWTCRLVRERLSLEYFTEKRDFKACLLIAVELDGKPTSMSFECPLNLNTLFKLDEETRDIAVRFLTLEPDVQIFKPFYVSLSIKNNTSHDHHFILKESKGSPVSVVERCSREPAFLLLEFASDLGVIKSGACFDIELRLLPLKKGSQYLPDLVLQSHRCIEILKAHLISVK